MEGCCLWKEMWLMGRFGHGCVWICNICTAGDNEEFSRAGFGGCAWAGWYLPVLLMTGRWERDPDLLQTQLRAPCLLQHLLGHLQKQEHQWSAFPGMLLQVAIFLRPRTTCRPLEVFSIQRGTTWNFWLSSIYCRERYSETSVVKVGLKGGFSFSL